MGNEEGTEGVLHKLSISVYTQNSHNPVLMEGDCSRGKVERAGRFFHSSFQVLFLAFDLVAVSHGCASEM